ncbi:DUF535 family protein [Janthinobacterium agaricidamnosum]|uniref:DUF535 domain-containing protein n=1 Tax=Janthinobacterium agaricidamnosum NBRC 102515 = DSM 9628 TaxID=1349767 RepID=W0V6G6_9BURK|nr:DUF535 family protein [Janthinobacterium agaricidamnosum]CDG83205.1 conserved hypothetical protein [Janthinobacterium agaricidamnosum NBRC 102515 = DSM 9628]
MGNAVPQAARLTRAPEPVRLRTVLNAASAGFPYLRESLKLLPRFWLHYRLTQDWIGFWNSTPVLTCIAHESPGLLKKIYRPYLSRRLDRQQRLALLQSHYRLVLRHGLAGLVQRAAAAPVLLASFDGKSGATYQIRLVALVNMEREGEMVLQLFQRHEVVFSIAFTLSCQSGAAGIAVGCLQGGRGEERVERIRQATRDLFGLRPKALMVRLVQHIGLNLECRDMVLAGNVNRVLGRQLRKGLVHADYDATWLEMGARPRADGDFDMPCRWPAIDYQAIASNKRSEARKRQALLGQIADLTWAGLQG